VDSIAGLPAAAALISCQKVPHAPTDAGCGEDAPRKQMREG
jgi:hypothetical protein